MAKRKADDLDEDGDSPLLLSPDVSDDEDTVNAGVPQAGKNSARASGFSDDEGEGQPEIEAGGEEEDEEVNVGKREQVQDPDKMQALLKRLTPDQMNRYEVYRRSGFQKAQMKRFLQNVAGCTISMPMTIVMSGIAKIFVGEVVETARMIMAEQNEEGPIRPCHIRQAYRRLKLEGKIPTRSRPSLFH